MVLDVKYLRESLPNSVEVILPRLEWQVSDLERRFVQPGVRLLKKSVDRIERWHPRYLTYIHKK